MCTCRLNECNDRPRYALAHRVAQHQWHHARRLLLWLRADGGRNSIDEPEILHDTAAVVAAIEEVTVDKTFDADKDFDVDNLEHLDADDLLILLDTINLPFGELANWR